MNAEERALQAYPKDMQQLIKFDHSIDYVDANARDRRIYRQGYEQAEKDLQEQPSEDLANAAWEYASKECEYDAFTAGAKWQKEQMMKNSQAAEIGYFRHSGLSILTDKSIERMPFKEGDKVKVIIIKEDKK